MEPTFGEVVSEVLAQYLQATEEAARNLADFVAFAAAQIPGA